MKRNKLLLVLSSVALGLGLFAPCMRVNPRFGDYTVIVSLLNPSITSSNKYSIASGIWSLFSDGNFFIGSVIFIFSILFPLWKLGVLWVANERASKGEAFHGAFKLIEKLGKFSMIDIFVIALLVVAIKGLPGGSSIDILWGVVAFTFSVLLSMKVPGFIRSINPDKNNAEG